MSKTSIVYDISTGGDGDTDLCIHYTASTARNIIGALNHSLESCFDENIKVRALKFCGVKKLYSHEFEDTEVVESGAA